MNSPQSTFVPVPQAEVDFLGTAPVPASAYYDPDWYELERKAVFLRSWVNIGHVCEVPGPGDFIHRTLEFARASLLIVRGKQGEVRSFHNACTHRGTRLVREAQGHRANFRCPYHSWTFGQDGALLSAPDFDGFHVSKPECALKQVRTEVVAGLIFVNFDPDAAPLREQLGDFAAEMDTVPVARATEFSEYTYELKANWKIVYDNFQENYHLRFIHPRTAGRGGLWEGNPFGYPSSFSLNGIHRTQTIWSNPEPDMGNILTTMFARGIPRLMKEGLFDLPHTKEYFALFPNLFLLCNPAQHFLHTVYPVSAEKSRGTIRVYWVGADETPSDRFFREMSMATVRDVHSEDVDIIRAGQKGISSGAIEHIHLQEKEVLLRHLIEVVVEKVEAWQAETGAV